MYQRLKDHLAWVKGEMQTWITADQAGRGLYADYLYNAITGNWERKRPVWAMLMVNGLTASDIASRYTTTQIFDFINYTYSQRISCSGLVSCSTC